MNLFISKCILFFKSSAVKLTLFTAFLFSIFAFILLGYIYFKLIGNEKHHIDLSLQKEAELLKSLYNEKGYTALERTVFFKTFNDDQKLYAIYNVYGKRRIGNLYIEFSSPPNTPIKTYQYETKNDQNSSDITRHIRIIYTPLPGGNSFFIGKDIEELNRLSNLLFKIFITAILISFGLALLAGYLVNRNFSLRIEAINKVAKNVQKGILSQRVKRSYSYDELDLLSKNLNNMLGKIEILIKASRQSGDNLAHDLRSPISRLKTRLESSARTVSEPKSRQALLDCASDTNHLLKTFEAILSISRLEDGEQRGVFYEFCPNYILEDMQELYEPVCEKKQLTLKTEIHSKKKILADKALLAQALSNIIDNALKYVPKGNVIILGYQSLSDQRVELYVEDTGKGIPKAYRKEVIKRFVRLDKSRSQPGNGLGLSLVKAIADIHQAEFVLNSAQYQKESNPTPGLRASLIFPNSP